MHKHLAKTSLLALLLVAFGLSACTPAAGRITAQYRASVPAVIAAIAEEGIGMRPSNLYDHFSIYAIGDHFITLHANSTVVLSFVLGNNAVILSFNVIQQGQAATLVASGNRGTLGTDAIDLILQGLDRRFPRLE